MTRGHLVDVVMSAYEITHIDVKWRYLTPAVDRPVRSICVSGWHTNQCAGVVNVRPLP
jgi:hypothetical protein